MVRVTQCTCMHSTRETYEKEANELHSEEALEDPNVQSDTGCIDSNVGQTSSAMLISADDTGRGNCDCAVPSQLIESAPHSLSVGHTLRCTAECCLNHAVHMKWGRCDRTSDCGPHPLQQYGCL
ncbi:hypothetical protein EMCRGX_G011297 [Ephydatia muelleri]